VPTVGSNNGFTAIQNYAYDSLNRLQSAEEVIDSQTSWKQTFTFDRYGNRNFDEANTTMPTSFAYPNITNPTVSASNNRFASGQDYSYDLSGNTTTDATGQTFIYDAENKQVEVSDSNGVIGQYWYDGDGKRIKKYVPATSETTVFVYDSLGRSVAEYSTIVASPQNAKVSYLTNDHLGSPRINTDANGAVTARHDYHPFGEEIYTTQRTAGLGYAADTVRKQFTGYERDNETELDYAKARMFGSGFGRFTSPDPYKIVAEIEFEETSEKARAKLNNYLRKPQQWNAYAYAINNPLRYTDPTGEIIKLTGTDAEVQAKLKRLNDFLGDERFNLIKKSSDGRILYLNDKDICGGNYSKFANIGNNAEIKDFSKKFADILASPRAVRFNIGLETFFKPQTGPVDGRGVKTLVDIRARGGAFTLSTEESMSGEIEIWVAPNAAQAGNNEAIKRNTSTLTRDGSQLRFPDNSVVDAHEFGHGYDLLNGLPDGTNSVGFENAARANRPGTQRRKSEH